MFHAECHLLYGKQCYRGTMTICKCGNKARTNQRYCWECHALHMREWRSVNPLSKDQRLKMNARCYINVYIKRGKVKRGKCEVCQSPHTQPHHEDYSKPLQARWFCRRHHLGHHHKVKRKSTIEKYARLDRTPEGSGKAALGRGHRQGNRG